MGWLGCDNLGMMVMVEARMALRLEKGQRVMQWTLKYLEKAEGLFP